MDKWDKVSCNKSENQFRHAKRRFKERFDIDYTFEIAFEMEHQIKNGFASFVSQESQRVLKYDVKHDGKIFRVVYDKKRNTIVTVLPDKSRSSNRVNSNRRIDGWLEKRQYVLKTERFARRRKRQQEQL